MKFKIKQKDCQLIVKVKTSFGETIDQKEIDRFSRAFLRGFLKPKIIKKNLIEYTGPVGISLYDRMKKPISKRDFLFILEQIVVAIQKLKANDMPLNNLVMSVQNVYINEITREVQFLYIPMAEKQNSSNLIEFIETIVYSVKPADDNDTDFVSRFIYYFKALKPFDINMVEKFVAKEDRSVVNTIKKQNAGQSGFMTDKPKHYYEHYNGNGNHTMGDEPTGLLNEEDEPTGLLNEEDEPTGLLNEEDEPTGLLNEEDEATGLLNDEDEATGLLISDSNDDTDLLYKNDTNVHYPTLYRVLTEETISVNKPVYRLGKERSYVDYFVTNNIAVSRSHADIITRGKQYFVKDLNSKNHTYINGRELPVHCEVEIHNGDNLTLGNEEFVFKT